MRARTKTEEIPIPEGRRFWAVNLGTEAEPNLHHFRMPRYTVACPLVSMGDSTKTIGKNASIGENLRRGFEARYHAAIVGACWHNRTALLDTPPLAGLLADLDKYGEAVVDELQDRYSLGQITAMGEACDAEVRSRLDYITQGAERAAFTTAETEAAEPQGATADPSPPEK